MDLKKLFQIDADYRRRAQFMKMAQALGAHGEPFDSVDELVRFANRQGVVFVHDEGSLVPDTIAALEADANFLPVVAYGEAPATSRVVDVLHAGAMDYMNWPLSAATVGRRIARMLDRSTARVRTSRARAVALRKVSSLSPREEEVLSLLAVGNSNKDIASELGISPRTVEVHRANVMGKIGETNAAGAVRVAIEAGLGGRERSRPVLPLSEPGARSSIPFDETSPSDHSPEQNRLPELLSRLRR